MRMQEQLWVHFAASALGKLIDTENHVRTCAEAGKFADEMLLQFKDRFVKEYDEFEFSGLPKALSTDPSVPEVDASRFGSQDSSFRSSRTQADKNREDKAQVTRRELDAELREQDRKIADAAINNGAVIAAARASTFDAESLTPEQNKYPGVVEPTLSKADNPVGDMSLPRVMVNETPQGPVAVDTNPATATKSTAPLAADTPTTPATPSASRSVAPKK